MRTFDRPPIWHTWMEWIIHGAASIAIVAIILIFGFIGREALPLVWEAGQLEGFRARDLFFPRQWPGYDELVYVWQPVGHVPKYNVVPLLLGSLKVTLMAMAVSAPLGLASAIYVAFYASHRTREIVKPLLELLAGIPSVVLGFFGLMMVASWFHGSFGFTYRLNAFVAAIALSITVVPIIFTISEDALSSVPTSLQEAAVALGARTHQRVLSMAVPAALPGITAAMVLGFGRAIGETMIVLMASGNAAVTDFFDWSTSARTVTATIAAELGEVPRGSPHWRILFLLGVMLFIVTFVLNGVARWTARYLGRRWRGAN